MYCETMRASKRRCKREETEDGSTLNVLVEESMQKAEDAAKALQSVKRPTAAQVTKVLLSIENWPSQTILIVL